MAEVIAKGTGRADARSIGSVSGKIPVLLYGASALERVERDRIGLRSCLTNYVPRAPFRHPRESGHPGAAARRVPLDPLEGLLCKPGIRDDDKADPV
jgi:hypothetical protein